MPKRSPGEGSILQRRDGRWQIALQVNGTRRTAYAKSEREARAKLRELQRQADQAGALPTPGRRTVSDLFDEWLDAAQNLKPSTVAQYRLFATTYIFPVLGETRLEQVTPDRLQKLYSGLSPSVADKVHRLMHRAFSVAVLWRWLASNPCERVLRPSYQSARPTVWSQAELDTFLENTAAHWLHPLWVLLVATGCRLGEALALRWESVGLGGVALTVVGTLHRIDGEWVVGDPKTPAAVRTVMLPAVAINALERQRAQQQEWRDLVGTEWPENGLVFTGKTGKPLFHSTVQHALKRECARLDLPALTPHGLRHLHASLLLNEGVPITAVSARLGHATPQITMRIYAHSLAGQDAQAAQAIGHVLVPSTAIESRDEVGLGVDME